MLVLIDCLGLELLSVSFITPNFQLLCSTGKCSVAVIIIIVVLEVTLRVTSFNNSNRI